MSNRFEALLPTPDNIQRKEYNPEFVMEELTNDLLSKYGTRIVGAFASTTETAFADSPVLDYTYYLIFARHDNFSYPLFTAKCINGNGSYPLRIMSHYAPPNDHGTVYNYESFSEVVEKILKEERTRTVILSMY